MISALLSDGWIQLVIPHKTIQKRGSVSVGRKPHRPNKKGIKREGFTLVRQLF